ncbi:response regulator transcription factor [Flavobacterium sp. I3-2]|uniref:response regulator transcription factor n=1 Tax=Flavobacterium sp. I3-2 TaxID=2748319 RepID=UPI0015B0F716|nr:response regulator transcription factor [Flavobacterium sp. I3-2]
MKILIIEDEIELQKVVQQALEKEKFLVESANNFKSALDKIISFDYDCILLDINLPDGNGMDLLREIKKLHKQDAVIIVSAKDSVDDKVLGLNLGADDYLAKPFHLAELHARINSIMRRNNQNGEKFISFKNVKINPEERSVFVNDNLINLNRKEYDMLYYFMIRPRKTLQKTTLAESIWGDHIEDADSLDFIYSQIKNLRKKLKQSQADIDFQAVYGIGYKLI